MNIKWLVQVTITRDKLSLKVNFKPLSNENQTYNYLNNKSNNTHVWLDLSIPKHLM